MQPQNAPHLPCRTDIARPQSGQSGDFAVCFVWALHTGCFSLLYAVAVFEQIAQFIFYPI